MPDEKKTAPAPAPEKGMPRQMQKQVTITAITGDSRNARVFLSDGSELVGLLRVNFGLTVNDVPTIELTARVMDLAK